MTSSRTFLFALNCFVISAALALGGCASKKAKEDGDSSSGIANADINTSGDSDSGKAMGLQTVHFPYDAFALNPEAKTTLKANADILKSNEKVKIQIKNKAKEIFGNQ